MANKGLFSIIIFVIVLIAALSFGAWFVNTVAIKPADDIQRTATMQIKKEIYDKIVSDSAAGVTLPLEDANFGRPNPFLNY